MFFGGLRRRAAAAGGRGAKLAACMREAPRADVYHIDALTIRPDDVRDDVPSRIRLQAFRIASSRAMISLEQMLR